MQVIDRLQVAATAGTTLLHPATGLFHSRIDTRYALLQFSRREVEVRAGFLGEMADAVDVAGAVVGEGLRPTPGVVMFRRAAESTPGVELRIEKPDAPLDPAAKSLEPLFW